MDLEMLLHLLVVDSRIMKEITSLGHHHNINTLHHHHLAHLMDLSSRVITYHHEKQHNSFDNFNDFRHLLLIASHLFSNVGLWYQMMDYFKLLREKNKKYEVFYYGRIFTPGKDAYFMWKYNYIYIYVCVCVCIHICLNVHACIMFSVLQFAWWVV